MKKSSRRVRKTSRKSRRYAKRRKIRRSNIRYGGLMGIEKKYVDRNFSATDVAEATSTGAQLDSTDADVCVNSVGQGNDVNQREGKVITMASLHVRGRLVINHNDAAVPEEGTNSPTDEVFQIFVILDTQNNGTGHSSTANNLAKVISAPADITIGYFRDIEYVKRFKIIGYKMITFKPIFEHNSATPGTWFPNNGLVKYFKMDINLKGIKVNFLSTGTDDHQANITDNAINIYAFRGNQNPIGSGTSNLYTSTLNCSTRLRYFG